MLHNTDTIAPPIILTDAAAFKVNELIREENNPKLNLRVFVTGGGCSGFQYGFTFDEHVKEKDTKITKTVVPAPNTDLANHDGESTTVSVLVDPISFQYLSGAEIDYQSGLEGEQFVISNPNARTTCGCGASFSA